MVTSRDWDRVKYRYPRISKKATPIPELIGIDSEAYKNGEPFMFCDSKRHCWSWEQMWRYWNFRAPPQIDYAVYNLKYDSGAILYYLPLDIKEELREKGETRYRMWKLSYIPHKYLGLSRKGCKIRFWDISQYYKSSLDKAAQTYLGRKKIELETKTFTKAYVREHWKDIRRYCIRDSILTGDLGNFLLCKLGEFGIRATALYSSASLSFRYFCDRGKVVTSWRFWQLYQDVLKFSCDAYQGGKFEVTARGTFEGTEYDLVSAYPWEIYNLVDISLARPLRSKVYQSEAEYGWLRCEIQNPDGRPMPFGVLQRGVRTFPAGRFFLAITKEEYDYAMAHGLEPRIIDAVWLFVRRKRYPYRKVIDELFALKAEYKGKDTMLYNVSKVMMNSFYGKTCQMIEDWKGTINAGIGWNPMYASYITARTRIRVTEMQRRFGERCLGVHTDSIIITDTLPAEEVTGEFGGWDHVVEGKGCIIGCGMYHIGGAYAYKGFVPKRTDSWPKLLRACGRKAFFEYPQQRAISWMHALAMGRPEKINYFEQYPKRVDLNADSKRAWARKATGSSLLRGLEQSFPQVYLETEPPHEWKH